MADFSLSSLAPYTTQPPIPQSPSYPSLRPRLDLDFPSNFYDSPAGASASTSAPSPSAPSPSASISAASISAAPVAPSTTSSRHLHQNRATRSNTNRILFGASPSTATHNPASPPAPDQASAPARTSAEAFSDSEISALDGFFDDFENFPHFPHFPLPFAETLNTSYPSTSDTMPTASTARRRTLRSQVLAPETHDDDSTATANVNKRRRVMPSAAEPASLQSMIDDDDESLFGSSPSRPDSSSGLKSEEYTTIDLTEATDVPDELKKPVVDNRVKLSAFQCVICMDNVTGLTLTHCGHLFCAQCLYSSLSIESTRGKCPMCRAKIDMKPRENYHLKTKGYWPLELKLMTRTRQGKRKAQAMA
ncbi:hypothetical protein V8C37DRAFT_363660 [Trichoderma ceciliae]